MTLEVYDSAGERIGETTLDLGAGDRISQILSVLVPDTVGKAGGYILLKSTQPLIGQQFFGTPQLSLLSSVPPKILQ